MWLVFGLESTGVWTTVVACGLFLHGKALLGLEVIADLCWCVIRRYGQHF